MKKGDIGMAKCFSKKYGNKGWASTTCNPMSRCLSAPDATSLHHCLQNLRQYYTIFNWIQELDTKGCCQHWVRGFLRYMPSPFYSASVVLFQLHGGMVSHMQALATPSCTHYLDTYHWKHISFGCLFLRQWCRDVASGADRHLDIGLQVVEAHPLFPYFLEKRLAIPISPFFIY